MGDDPRYTVTFTESEFPEWPIAVHYLFVVADNGARDYFNVGIEIGKRFKVEPGAGSTELEHLPRRRIDPAVLRHVVDNYAGYEERARAYLQGGTREGSPEVVAGDGARRKRREITPAFLQTIAAQHDQHEKVGRSPLKELAKDYGVNPSTASRWVKEARDRGYIEREATG